MRVLVTLAQEPEDTDGKWLAEAFDAMLARSGGPEDMDNIHLGDGDSEFQTTKIVRVPDGVALELEKLLEAIETVGEHAQGRHSRAEA
jgi:hypothetical protein